MKIKKLLNKTIIYNKYIKITNYYVNYEFVFNLKLHMQYLI